MSTFGGIPEGDQSTTKVSNADIADQRVLVQC